MQIFSKEVVWVERWMAYVFFDVVGNEDQTFYANCEVKMVHKVDPREKTVVDPDIVFVELDGPRGRGLGYYKKNSPKLETARDHPKIEKVMQKIFKKDTNPL